jgi:predicted CoA-binding protein
MKQKKTLVIGASEDPTRYSYLAVKKLLAHGHEVIAIGKKEGSIDNIPIIKGQPSITDIDTITLYINPTHQTAYYDYIISLKPLRIIFNPGTENNQLTSLAQKNNIETKEACTLVMLSTGQY